VPASKVIGSRIGDLRRSPLSIATLAPSGVTRTVISPTFARNARSASLTSLICGELGSLSSMKRSKWKIASSGLPKRS
jgi:hypothetical protein